MNDADSAWQIDLDKFQTGVMGEAGPETVAILSRRWTRSLPAGRHEDMMVETAACGECPKGQCDGCDQCDWLVELATWKGTTDDQ